MRWIATSLLLFSPFLAAEDLANFDAGRENRAGLTFSPDGNTAYWVEWDGKWGGRGTSPRAIYVSVKESDDWSEPSAVAFSGGEFNDDDPFVSPDGEWLYFVSDRPTQPGDESADGNIWRFRIDEGREPELVDINSPGEEYSPIITDSGNLYFASDRDGGLGQGDLYIAATDGKGFSTPTPLDKFVNSKYGEWNLWVSPDESLIIFESSSRPTNISVPGDLYYSFDCRGPWRPVFHMPLINSSGSDLLPRMHPDGKTLYFTTAFLGGHAVLRSIPFKTSNPCND